MYLTPSMQLSDDPVTLAMCRFMLPQPTSDIAKKIANSLIVHLRGYLLFFNLSLPYFTSRSSTASRSRTCFTSRVSAASSSRSFALSRSRYSGCWCFCVTTIQGDITRYILAVPTVSRAIGYAPKPHGSSRYNAPAPCSVGNRSETTDSLALAKALRPQTRLLELLVAHGNVCTSSPRMTALASTRFLEVHP
jgi:hypothetical protein